MLNNDSAHNYEETVSFDQKGNVVVNKDSHAPKKLVARRAIEAMQERRRIESDMSHYDFD